MSDLLIGQKILASLDENNIVRLADVGTADITTGQKVVATRGLDQKVAIAPLYRGVDVGDTVLAIRDTNEVVRIVPYENDRPRIRISVVNGPNYEHKTDAIGRVLPIGQTTVLVEVSGIGEADEIYLAYNRTEDFGLWGIYVTENVLVDASYLPEFSGQRYEVARLPGAHSVLAVMLGSHVLQAVIKRHGRIIAKSQCTINFEPPLSLSLENIGMSASRQGAASIGSVSASYRNYGGEKITGKWRYTSNGGVWSNYYNFDLIYASTIVQNGMLTDGVIGNTGLFSTTSETTITVEVIMTASRGADSVTVSRRKDFYYGP